MAVSDRLRIRMFPPAQHPYYVLVAPNKAMPVAGVGVANEHIDRRPPYQLLTVSCAHIDPAVWFVAFAVSITRLAAAPESDEMAREVSPHTILAPSV